jgi:hypothetical protein
MRSSIPLPESVCHRSGAHIGDPDRETRSILPLHYRPIDAAAPAEQSGVRYWPTSAARTPPKPHRYLHCPARGSGIPGGAVTPVLICSKVRDKSRDDEAVAGPCRTLHTLEHISTCDRYGSLALRTASLQAFSRSGHRTSRCESAGALFRLRTERSRETMLFLQQRRRLAGST